MTEQPPRGAEFLGEPTKSWPAASAGLSGASARPTASEVAITVLERLGPDDREVLRPRLTDPGTKFWLRWPDSYNI